MIIEFENFTIAQIQEKDTWSICDLMLVNEDRFKAYFPITLAQNTNPTLAKLFAQKKVKQFQNNEEYLFILKENKTHKAIGLIYIKALDWNHKKGELAYCLDYNFKGQNLMSKAVKYLNVYAFAELGLASLQIIVHKKNKASIKVATNNNFTWQKTLPKEYTPPNSAPLDMELYEKHK